jgi:hypothetical protein
VSFLKVEGFFGRGKEAIGVMRFGWRHFWII